ncbi:MAG: DUF4386 family protein [Candidatus Cyclobacteriaceae bacterium M3_2C_046]
MAHPAIGSINLLNHFLAYQILGGAEFLAPFSAEQLQAFSLLFMDTHRYGYLIAGAFFGVHLFLMGVLIYRSDIIPHLFGGLILALLLVT